MRVEGLAFGVCEFCFGLSPIGLRGLGLGLWGFGLVFPGFGSRFPGLGLGLRRERVGEPVVVRRTSLTGLRALLRIVDSLGIMPVTKTLHTHTHTNTLG